jgi:hypothetical protein
VAREQNELIPTRETAQGDGRYIQMVLVKYFHINITSGITETNAFIKNFLPSKVRKREERERKEGRKTGTYLAFDVPLLRDAASGIWKTRRASSNAIGSWVETLSCRLTPPPVPELKRRRG